PYCLSCIMGLVSSLPPDQEQNVLEQLAHRRSSEAAALADSTPRRATPRKTSTSRIPVVKTERSLAPPRTNNSTVLLIAGAAVLVLVVGVLVAGSSGSGEVARRKSEAARSTGPIEIPRPDAPPPKPATDPEASGDAPAIRREDAARKALEKARAFG